MREIKFRGLRTDGKGWVYGDMATYWAGMPMIMPKCYFTSSDLGSEDENGKAVIGKKLAIEGFVYVIPETIGQFTGLKDKNGVDIYEGDVVKILYTDWVSKSDKDIRSLKEYLWDLAHDGVVVFQKNGWFLEMYSEKFQEEYLSAIEHGTHGFIEVIGNIHQI